MSTGTLEAPQKAKVLRIRVVDTLQDGKPAVNVNMPIGLVKFGMKMAKAFVPEMRDVDVDWDEVTKLLESGELGKIVEVEDQAEHKHVEVWVD